MFPTRRYWIIIIWTILVGASLVWNILSQLENQRDVAFSGARMLFNTIVLTRQWNARHGTIYAPVSDIAVPNLYLDPTIIERNVETTSGRHLTVINPAYMTRQLSELSENRDDSCCRFRITSIDPINPGNLAHGWDRKALEMFDRDPTITEFGEIVPDSETGKQGFRYIAPLYAKPQCLTCHSDYEVGQIRGGITVELPYVMNVPIWALIHVYGLIWLVGMAIILRYLHVLKQSSEHLQKMASNDGLTGIPNRRHFDSELERACKQANSQKTPLSLIMLDIDYFKSYNDTYGHTRGDDCLKQISLLLVETIRTDTDFVARYGGEEFVIILNGTGSYGARKIAERVRRAVENQKIPHQGSELDHVTVSLGLCTLEGRDIEPIRLVQCADEALYTAKQNGRNRIETS